MAWINPKIDWANGDTLASTDFNRIEGNILELKNGKLDTDIADGRYLKLTGGTLSGDLNVGGNIKITKTACNFLAPNNYGYTGLDTSGNVRYLLWLGGDNQIKIGYSQESPTINIEGATTIATSLNVGGTGTINNLVVSGGSMTINKNGFTSTINFAKQTNDGGYIQHYENNNASYLRFVVSDDTSADDYFSFGSTPSNVYKELMRLDTRGALALNGSITASGNITSNGGEFILNNNKRFKCKNTNGDATTVCYVNTGDVIVLGNGTNFISLHGTVTMSNFIRSTNISGSTGGIAFSSGGSADRRLFIGTNTDWSGGQPKGGTFGDIWIRI